MNFARDVLTPESLTMLQTIARLGSFAAAASVTSEEDDRIRSLRNRLEEGNWLLLIEAPNGIEMPWTTLQQAKPKAVVRLND